MEYGSFYVELKDLTDSIKPLGLLSNNVADMTIHVISANNKNKLKKIAPARVDVYLLNKQLDKNDIKSLFSKSDNRLDHKELFFPVLQQMAEFVDNVGHWFTVCLNLKAERFEILNSLRNE
ncbi:hypothetical protein E2562_009591, partial [Oryza meyeriana var. granulata]